MNVQKKFISMLLCLGIFALLAFGSTSSDSKKKSIVTDEKTQSAVDDTKAPNSVGDTKAPSTVGDTKAPSTVGDTKAPSTDDEITAISIDEQLLIEQNGIKITAKSFTTDFIWGDGIKLLIENNSGKDVRISCDALIVNDYMITDLFSKEVAAGMKSNETLYLSTSALKAAEIDAIGKIEIYFAVSDKASFETIFKADPVIIKTSAFDKMDTVANDEGAELYNNGGIRIIGKTVDENSFWGSAVLLYIENSTGANISITCDSMAINGFMTTPLFHSTVYAGRMAVDPINILSSQLEENNITSIDEVQVKFRIRNADTYALIAETDNLTFKTK